MLHRLTKTRRHETREIAKVHQLPALVLGAATNNSPGGHSLILVILPYCAYLSVCENPESSSHVSATQLNAVSANAATPRCVGSTL
jgi:hypothetical protein